MKPMTVEEVAAEVGRGTQQIVKWIKVGLKNPTGGPRIRLRAEKVGGGWAIQRADLKDFCRRRTEAVLAKADR